jgi:methionine aminopeptidase
MSKAIIGIGHNEYILDISDAVTVAEIMAKAENFKVKHDYTVTPTTVAYFIWEQEVTLSRNHVTIHLLPDAVYRVAKLAGKPQD